MIQYPSGYQTRLKILEFLNLSYEGGTAYREGNDAAGNSVLVKSKREIIQYNQSDTTNYEARKAFAVYRNYYKTIFDKIADYVLSQAVTRDDGLQNTNVADKMSKLVSYGVPQSIYYVGVDAPELQGEILSAYHQQVLEKTPYLILVDPRNVVDWEVDADGYFQRLVYTEQQIVKPSMADQETVYIIYREWTPAECRIYRVKENETPDVPTEVKSHTFGAVPFDLFSPDLPNEDIADLNRHLFNLQSLQDMELVRNTFTSWLFAGLSMEDLFQRDEETGKVKGAREIGEAIFGDEAAKVTAISPDPDAARVLAEAILSDIDEIYRLAGLTKPQSKAQVESGEAKRRDFQDLEALLKSVAQEAERVENNLLPYIGEYEPSQWPQQFDVRTIQEMLDDALKDLSMPFTPVSYMRKVRKELIEKRGPAVDNTIYVRDVDDALNLDEPEAKVMALMEEHLTDELIGRQLGVDEKTIKANAAKKAEPVPLQAFEEEPEEELEEGVA